MERKEYWETIYKTRASTEVSWFQEHPLLSLELIRKTNAGPGARLIDVGGGASTLVDHLLESEYRDITVLDISPAALATAKKRLGARSAVVHWWVSDITKTDLPLHSFDLWHDRAVFHFLTSVDGRRTYVEKLLGAVKPGGHVILATFALDGPPQCSGLEVAHYSPQTLSQELGPDFKLLEEHFETHVTPFDTTQKFQYSLFRRA